MFVACEKEGVGGWVGEGVGGWGGGWVGGGDNSNAKIPPTDAPHPKANQDVILLTRTSLQRAERMKTRAEGKQPSTLEVISKGNGEKNKSSRPHLMCNHKLAKKVLMFHAEM